MKTDSKSVQRISGSLHIALWWVAFFLAVVVVTLCIALLHGLLRSGHATVDVVAWLVLSVAALAGVLAYWRRYWFRPADLRRLISAHEGTDFRQRSSLSGVQIKARLGTLWLLATLNRPILDVLPTWPTYELQRKLALGVPEFMLEGARVALVQLGDFTQLPQIDIVAGRQKVEPVQTGNGLLDRAIRASTAALEDEDIKLRIEIRPRWLQVEVNGGAWLGSRFAEKIEHAIEFSRRLIEELTGSFTPVKPIECTVEQEYVHVRRGFLVGSLERRLHITPAQ